MSKLSMWRKKKKKKEKVNVPITGRHALLSLVVFWFCSSFIHSVCAIYDHAFGMYIDLKRICYKKGVIKGYIILCTVHYLLLLMATF